jgi:hypothetical protein
MRSRSKREAAHPYPFNSDIVWESVWMVRGHACLVTTYEGADVGSCAAGQGFVTRVCAAVLPLEINLISLQVLAPE